VIHARKTVKNVSQTKTDVEEFHPIVHDMVVAMKEFDDLWGTT